MKNTLLGFLLLTLGTATAQVLADFETAETSVIVRGDSSATVDNPNLVGNTSKRVATYKKAVGNWKQMYFELGKKVNVKKNTVLSFLINSTTKGRVFVKIWDGSTLLKEDWAPTYDSRPEPNTWAEVTFDITSLQGKNFDRVEVFGSVDNEAPARIYFDNLRMYNPLSLNGEPIAGFISTENPDGSFTFDASESYDADGSIVQYSWRFNGGEVTESISPLFNKTFTQAGNYEVSLEITDNEDKKSVTKQTVVVFESGAFSSPLRAEQSAFLTNQKIELTFLIDKIYVNPYDDEVVKVDAKIIYPNGSQKQIPCFYIEKGSYATGKWLADPKKNNWALRFSSPMSGTHTIEILLTDKDRKVTSKSHAFSVAQSVEKGIIGVDETDKQVYRHQTGETYTPLGINVAWNSMEEYNKIFNNLADGDANFVRYWMVPFNKQALEWKDDGYTHGIGRYSQAAAAFNDSLFALADSKGIHLQMVLFQHGMFSENVNSNWSDNPYNATSGGPLTRAEEYFYNESAKKSTKKLLRYIVARYGYSQKLFAWELFNEVQFTGIHNSQTEQWKQGVLNWHNEMGKYLKELDEFDHLVATSASDQQLFQMDSLDGLDVLQYHVYNTNLTKAILDRNEDFKTRLKNKAIFCGEYGLDVNTAAVPFDIQRNLIWTGIFDKVPMVMWLWSDYTNRAWSDLFKFPAAFTKEYNLASQKNLTDWKFTTDNASSTTIGKKSENSYFGMVFQVETGSSDSGTLLDLMSVANGIYSAEILDMETGKKTISEKTLAGSARKMELPNLNKGQVIVLKYLRPALNPVAVLQGENVIGENTAWEISTEDSYIPDGQPPVYTWQILKKPTGSLLTVNPANPLLFELKPDSPGQYEIVLGLKAGEIISYDTLKTYVNATPIAVISAPSTSKFGQDTEVSAVNSTDFEKDVLQYKWQITSPTGSVKTVDFGTQQKIRFVTDAGGVYLVELTVRDGFTQSKVVATEVSTEFALSTFLLDNEVKVYPIPASGFLNVELSGEMAGKSVSAELINLEGIVLSRHLLLVKTQIPLKVSAGIYFLRVSDGIRSETKKILVQ